MAIKISKAKRNNQKKNKLVKAGVIKKTKLKKKIPVIAQNLNVEQQEFESEESDNGEDMLQMVESDDIAFLKKSIANKSYSLFNKIKTRSERNIQNKLTRKSDDDYLEDMERQVEDSIEMRGPKTRQMLPIKTKSGIQQCEIAIEGKESTYDEQNAMEINEVQSEKSDEIYEDDASNQSEDFSTFPDDVPIPVLDLLFKCQQTYETEKQRISITCAQLIENPEQKIGNVRTICKKIEDQRNNFIVRKFAILGLLEVFIEILPMYNIRPHDMSVKLKKNTLQLYKYEDALLCAYKTYLRHLEKLTNCLSRKSGNENITVNKRLLAGVAVSCLCELLSAHPYFNYAENIIEVLVPLSNSKWRMLRILIRDTFKKLFKEDRKAELTLKVMRKINKLIQKKEKNMHPELLESFLSLKIKEVNLDQEIENQNKEKKLMSHKSNILQLSKKERKRKKKLELLEKELLETKSEESKSTINKNISEVTNMLFICYFRILKNTKNKKLIAISLQGLAKFAHCISIDYFIGMLNVLSQLMQDESLGYKEHLYCIQTAFTILISQDDVMTVDLIRFYKYLYVFLMDVPKHSQHFETLAETLRMVLISQRKKISRDRLLAFTKRLGIIALQLNGEELMHCLKLIRTIVQLSGNILNCVEHSLNERDGSYLPELDDPDTCNAFFAIMWETTLLQKSYACFTCKVVEYIAKGGSTNNASLEVTKLSYEELEPHFSPLIILENLLSKNSCKSNIKFKNNSEEFTRYCKRISKANKRVVK